MPLEQTSSSHLKEQALRVAQATLNLLFPPRCVVCGRVGAELCSPCLQSFTRLGESICPVCGVWQEGAGLCPRCMTWRPAFHQMRSAYRFEGGIRKAIHALKYEGRRGAAGPLAEATALVLTPDSRDMALCAVPLHVKRQAERGYNQSDLLAQELARYWGMPYLGEGAVQRSRETSPQVGLDFAARQANVYQAFAAQPERVRGRSIILVDDVCTTGATLDACAQALLMAGAVSVSAVTVARALKLEPPDR